jgi:hypothetical protein
MPETPPAPPPEPPRPRRLRGAPLNNLNALKHGFYARKLRPTDLVDLADTQFKGLEEEMNMLRIHMRTIIEQSSTAANLMENLETLRVLALAATSLARLAKTQKYLDGGSNGGPGWSTMAELNAMLEEAYQKLHTEGVPRDE